MLLEVLCVSFITSRASQEHLNNSHLLPGLLIRAPVKQPEQSTLAIVAASSWFLSLALRNPSLTPILLGRLPAAVCGSGDLPFCSELDRLVAAVAGLEIELDDVGAGAGETISSCCSGGEKEIGRASCRERVF